MHALMIDSLEVKSKVEEKLAALMQAKNNVGAPRYTEMQEQTRGKATPETPEHTETQIGTHRSIMKRKDRRIETY